MAYFEIDLTPDGTNNASLVGNDNEWQLDSETHIDVIVWNEAEVPVDVYLLGGSTNLDWVLNPDQYEDEHREVKWQSFSIDNGAAAGPELRITRLAPGAVFPVRLTYPLYGAALNWLDVDSSSMQVRGHGTNIFNGGRVYVAGHTPLSATG